MKDGRDGGFEYVKCTSSKFAPGLLIGHGIDKDFPLRGVVICFTSVQVERRVSAS
jgi:hypothetical protein